MRTRSVLKALLENLKLYLEKKMTTKQLHDYISNMLQRWEED